jgi:hypothetical protein
MVVGGKMSVIIASAVAQLDMGNLESFANTPTEYEDAGLFGGSGDYGTYGFSVFDYMDGSIFDMSNDAFEDADAGLFGSSTVPLTTTTTTTSTTTTTTTTTTPTPLATTEAPSTPPKTLENIPERAENSRMRVRPSRFDPAMIESMAAAFGGEDADIGLGFPVRSDSAQSDGGLSLSRGRPGRPVANPLADIPLARNIGSGGFCRVCEGEDAAGCRARAAVQCATNACLVRITGTNDTGYKYYSGCSTTEACSSAEAQNFVGPDRRLHQCRISQGAEAMLSRFSRNSVCSFCHRQGTSATEKVLFETVDSVETDGGPVSIDTILDTPQNYMVSEGGSYIFDSQTW